MIVQIEFQIDEAKFREFAHDMLYHRRTEMATQLNLLSDTVSANWAYKQYRQRFTLWVKRGLIKGDKQNEGKTSTKYFSRKELEILDKSENYEPTVIIKKSNRK